MAVNAARLMTAGGATGGFRFRPGYEHHLIGLGQDLDDRKLGRDQRMKGMVHGQIIGKIAIPTL
jgi:hypothetical protein